MDGIIEKYLAPGEDWDDLADRVSGIMQYHKERVIIQRMIATKMFLPNSPTLINAGKSGGRNMMACHLIEVPNSVEGIFETAKQSSMVFKSGGGIGLEFSSLSPRGTTLRYAPAGMASGVVSFMKVFNTAAEVVMEGGLRRAAIMGTLNAKHPDINDFITCKEQDGHFRNFNISVTFDDAFTNVGTGVWKGIVEHALWNGEPGVVFLKNINKTNPTLNDFGPINGVNACSEIPLYNYGSCVLASINLPRVIDVTLDLGRLKGVVMWAVRFLNRVIDMNHYPLPEIAQQTRKDRKIGIGVMGWDTLLKREHIPFTSAAALDLANEIAGTIYKAADEESWKLAARDGGYLPNRRRNSTLLAIAPTGHISRLAGVSFSIYPEYGEGLQMTPQQHLDHISAWQKWVDSAISYTVSVPKDAEAYQIEQVFMGAYDRGIKAISVYRDESRADQPCKAEGTCSI